MSTVQLEKCLTVSEAAPKVNMTTGRLRQLLIEGGLPGRKMGNIWLIPKAAVAKLARRKKFSRTP